MSTRAERNEEWNRAVDAALKACLHLFKQLDPKLAGFAGKIIGAISALKRP